MEKKDSLTKVLAILGTVLVWLPLLAPLFFSLRFIGSGHFNFDYLLPAEFFPVALAGGIQLAWAALRAHSRRRPILWGLGVAVVLLFVGQGVAVATGLASGATEPTFTALAPVIASIAAYAIGLVVAGIGGILLIRDLYKPSEVLA